MSGDKKNKKNFCKHLEYVDGLPICRHPQWHYRTRDVPCIELSAKCECDAKEIDK